MTKFQIYNKSICKWGKIQIQGSKFLSGPETKFKFLTGPKRGSNRTRLTSRSKKQDPYPIFHGSNTPSNRIIEYLFTTLLYTITTHNKKKPYALLTLYSWLQGISFWGAGPTPPWLAFHLESSQ